MKIRNNEGISKIVMKPFAECLCAIGRDWYHIEFEVTFMPSKYYPDYMDISKFISDNISGKEMNIETAVDVLGTMINKDYQPHMLTVKGIVNKVVTHFPVEVVKEFYKEVTA